jgi:hypothetical protein
VGVRIDAAACIASYGVIGELEPEVALVGILMLLGKAALHLRAVAA